MLTYIQPILIALAVIAIPASARWAARTIAKKLDEGRAIAEQNRADLTKSTAEEAHKVSDLLEEHRKEVLGELTLIKNQTTATNGKVAEHDKDIVRLTARTDLLLELAMKGKPE